MVNQYLAFIYDFELDRPITELNLCFQRINLQRLPKVDNLYIGGGSSGQILKLLRTKKNQEGEEIVERQKLIHFNDLIPNLSRMRGRGNNFSFFKLKNGNYLYIAAKYLEQDYRINPQNPQSRLVSVEIDSKTLNVVKFSLVLPAELENPVNVSDVKLIDDFLVFKTKARREENEADQGEEYESLVLASTDLKILDICREAKLERYGKFIVVSSTRIASIGHGTRLNRIYLHGVDGARKKLILLKSVVLKGALIEKKNHFGLLGSEHFCILAKSLPERGFGWKFFSILIGI